MALGGTALAQRDIIITDPSQLKDGVVTSTKVAPESVSNLRLRDPQRAPGLHLAAFCCRLRRCLAGRALDRGGVEPWLKPGVATTRA